jgi:WD40 repeat protein
MGRLKLFRMSLLLAVLAFCIAIVSAQRPSMRWLLGAPLGGGPIAISPDGSLLATAGGKTVSIYNASTRRLLRSYQLGEEVDIYSNSELYNKWRPTSLAFSPDGKTLAVSGYVSNDALGRHYGEVEIIDAALLSKVRVIVTGINRLSNVKYLQYGELLLCSGYSDGADSTAELHRISDGAVTRVLTTHGLGPVAVSVDQKTCYLLEDDPSSRQKVIAIRDIATSNLIREININCIYGEIQLTPDNSKVVFAGLVFGADQLVHSKIEVLDVLTGNIISEKDTTVRDAGITFSHNRAFVALFGDEPLVFDEMGHPVNQAVVEIWRVADWIKIATFEPEAAAVDGALFTENDAVLQLSCQTGFFYTETSLERWDWRRGSALSQTKSDVGFGWPYSIRWSPDGKTILFGGEYMNYLAYATNPVYIRDASSGHIKNLPSNLSIANAVAFSPDGTKLFSAGRSNRLGNPYSSLIEERSALSGDLITKAHSLHFPYDIQGMEVSPDGAVLACSNSRETGATGIEIRRCSDLGLIRFIPLPIISITDMKFSPDGKTLAVAQDDIKFLDVKTGVIRMSLPHNYGPYLKVCYTPDGTKLIATDFASGNTVKVFATSDGSVIRTVTANTRVLYSIAISPDGRFIYASGSDFDSVLGRGLFWWDINTGMLAGSYDSEVESLPTFSPEGSLMTVARSDGIAVAFACPTFQRPSLSRLSVPAPTVKGGQAFEASVLLSSVAPFDGTTVTVTTDNSALVTFPRSVRVPLNRTLATFSVQTVQVTSPTPVTLKAQVGNVVKTIAFTVTP